MFGKEFIYEPKLRYDLEVEGDELGDLVFEGSMRIVIFPAEERAKFGKSLNLKVNKEGEVELSEQAEVMQKILAFTKQNIASLDLKCNGVEIKDVNDLEFYEEGVKLLTEVSQIMFKGIRLGKPLEKKLKAS